MSHQHHEHHAPPTRGTTEEELLLEQIQPLEVPPTGHPDHRAIGHEDHAAHDVEEFRRRFWICLILTIPVLVYSDPVQSLLGYEAPAFPGSRFVPLALSTIIFFYGGSVFLRGAVAELGRLTPGMMTLISLAITTALVYSVATELGLPGMPLYWELATLIVVMLLGHWIELNAIGRARGAVAALAELLPDVAERIENGTPRPVPIRDLRPGDIVLVRPGARVPIDGVVVEGESEVNESMITGESRPVPKQPDGEVIGGTVNGSGSLRVRVTRVGEQTTLAGIMRLVEQAQHSRTRAQDLGDRAAYWLTLIAIAAGAITLVAWLALGAGTEFALSRTVTVLVIACPHALGLAIPLVVAISTTISARNGLLVRERRALESARDLDVVVFDKTGTLTTGEQGLVGVATERGLDEDTAIALAAAVEGDSEHAIARAIRHAAMRRGLELPRVRDFAAQPGRGVRARQDGVEVSVGGARLLELLGTRLPTELEAATRRWGEEGKSVVYLLRDGRPEAAFALADTIRPESREAVAELKKLGIQVAMLTGDSQAVARSVAVELGIQEYFAEVLPEHKSEKIQELRQRGLRVAMVGDGVNDAPALLAADIGIAIGAGTHVAIESAGIILVRDDPRDVVKVIRVSRASYEKMIQNLIWATGYNVVAIPLAAGVLASLGLVLTPAIGALLMSLSTVIVALNAQTLRRMELDTA